MDEIDSSELPVIIHEQANHLSSTTIPQRSKPLSTTQHGSVVKEAVSMVILFTLSNALVIEMVFVTGPAIIGHVGTDYTLSHNGSYLSDEVEYLHSITCIIRPIKCIKDAENFMAIP